MKKECLAIAFGGCLVLALICFGFALYFDHLAGLRWMAQALGVWALVCYLCWVRLPLNRASTNSPLYPNLGWANRSTLLRGLLIAATAGFLGHTYEAQYTWLPGLLYMAAAILDRLDGFIARRTGQSSLLGAQMDTSLDALGLVIAPLLAVSYGKLHWSFLLISAAFYLFQAAAARRRRAGLAVYPLPPSPMRRALAGFQMGFVAMVLLPPFQAPLTPFLGLCFMLPMLIGFIVDWLLVSGRLKISTFAVGRKTLWDKLNTLVLPPLRWLCFTGLLLLALSDIPVPVLITLTGFGALVILGAGARLGALGVLTFLAGYHGIAPLDALSITIIVPACAVLIFGSGRWSWAHWDSEWVYRHDGA